MVPLQILVQSSMASFPSQALVLLEEQLMLVIPASHIQFCIAWCSLERGVFYFLWWMNVGYVNTYLIYGLKMLYVPVSLVLLLIPEVESWKHGRKVVQLSVIIVRIC